MTREVQAEDQPEKVNRVITLGASNLTRGFSTVVNTARATYGEPLEILGALGHGRSYGIRSTILVRSLPGILESGLWSQLDALPSAPTQGLITDVGNDVLYHVPVPTILSWVEETATRLEKYGTRVTLTDLPFFNLRTLTRARYTLFRSVLVPSCRLSLAEATDRLEALNEGLVSIARAHRSTLVRLRPEWYGLDPMHILPRYWRDAWREILLAGLVGQASPPQTPARPLGGLGLYLARPARRWLFGIEERHPQPVIRSTGGTAIWLY